MPPYSWLFISNGNLDLKLGQLENAKHNVIFPEGTFTLIIY